MPLTIFHDEIRFCYKSKNWQYHFDEIKKLGMLRKKKKYFLENGIFIAVTASAYYCMIFSDIMELYYIIPALLCYTLIIISRLKNPSEFNYFVIVKDVYQNEIISKIEAKDRAMIRRQIDHFKELRFERYIKNTA